jgi:hypothetical protein
MSLSVLPHKRQKALLLLEGAMPLDVRSRSQADTPPDRLVGHFVRYSHLLFPLRPFSSRMLAWKTTAGTAFKSCGRALPPLSPFLPLPPPPGGRGGGGALHPEVGPWQKSAAMLKANCQSTTERLSDRVEEFLPRAGRAAPTRRFGFLYRDSAILLTQLLP